MQAAKQVSLHFLFAYDTIIFVLLCILKFKLYGGFNMAKNSQDRNMLFPFSFNVCRKCINNPNEYDKVIYDAFGLSHKSNTSNNYISAMNTVGSSAVCQPIGEAITLVKRFITSLDKGQSIAHYKTNNQGTESYIEIKLPQEYRDEGIVIPDLYSYEIYRKDNKITISAYNHVDCKRQI